MIKFHIFNEDLIDLQILDAWYAKQQHQESTLECEVNFDTNIKLNPLDTNVALGYIFNQELVDQRHKYDLVFFGNGGEPLEVATPELADILKESNTYLICNGFLSPDHELFDKIICFPHDVMLCLNYWTRHFYSLYFEARKLQTLARKPKLVAINGANKSNRNYFFSLLKEEIPDLDLKKSSLFAGIKKLPDCQWESESDRVFRDHVNNLYKDNYEDTNGDNYPRMKLLEGLNGKFGYISPGYYPLPEYYENSVVIFPETGWINNQVCLTEKACKCFFSGSLPLPVSGADTNKLYNSIGFYTAWNLLPEELQQFDRDDDHLHRYQGLITAIKWLWQNPTVFDSKEFLRMTDHNRILFLNNDIPFTHLEKFHQIVCAGLDQ